MYLEQTIGLGSHTCCEVQTRATILTFARYILRTPVKILAALCFEVDHFENVSKLPVSRMVPYYLLQRRLIYYGV